MKSTKIRLSGTVLAMALAGIGSTALAQDTLKIGVLATLEGALTVSGQDAMRGMELAMRQHNFTAGGKKIEVIRASSTGQPDTAVNAARKLIEQDKVAILIGPLSGSEGIAVKDYAKTQPNVVFVNGSSAAQETTLKDPASNFYRFSTDGAQWSAGLGSYVYNDKNYKKVAVVAEDYSFPYAQVQGFMIEFCKAG